MLSEYAATDAKPMLQVMYKKSIDEMADSFKKLLFATINPKLDIKCMNHRQIPFYYLMPLEIDARLVLCATCAFLVSAEKELLYSQSPQ